jgi:hypothetical protein
MIPPHLTGGKCGGIVVDMAKRKAARKPAAAARPTSKGEPASLADRIRQEIHRRGWSAYRVEKEAQIPETTAIRFMRATNDPTAGTIDKLLAAIGWTVGPTKEK